MSSLNIYHVHLMSELTSKMGVFDFVAFLERHNELLDKNLPEKAQDHIEETCRKYGINA